MKESIHSYRLSFCVHRMCSHKDLAKNSLRLMHWHLILLGVMSCIVGGWAVADETDNRRVDISLSIFPRIVAVDNQFREKLNADKKAYLLFVYDRDEKYAEELANRMQEKNANIGGMDVVTNVISVTAELDVNDPPTAVFLVEKLSSEQLTRVMDFSDKAHRLVFSPFLGDVERGVTVGISVTNRVKPYFNLSALRQSKVSINALLMKMSKRHE